MHDIGRIFVINNKFGNWGRNPWKVIALASGGKPMNILISSEY